MDKALEKLMEKKKDGKALDPEYKKAKMSVLGSLHDEMKKMIGDDLHGLKKVTVASPDKEGLEEGLEKAKELVSAKDEAEEPAEEEKAELCPECGEMHGEEGHMSAEEIETKIKELEALKAKLKA